VEGVDAKDDGVADEEMEEEEAEAGSENVDDGSDSAW
jgi:hypothetical protein